MPYNKIYKDIIKVGLLLSIKLQGILRQERDLT